MRESKRLVYQIYKQRKQDFMKGKKPDKKNWCYWTWLYLKQLHLEHLWESEKIESEQDFNKLVRELIKQKEEEEWREKVRKKSKLRLYRKLKNSLCLEDYVVELDRERRRQLTMIRGGTNKLRIETGRWMGERTSECVM